MEPGTTLEGRGMDSLYDMRIRAGLTQAEAADRMGVTQGRISEWEAGRYVPSTRSCVRLASVLGVDAGTIIAAVMGDAKQDGDE